jgi:hypothetical protein
MAAALPKGAHSRAHGRGAALRAAKNKPRVDFCDYFWQRHSHGLRPDAKLFPLPQPENLTKLLSGGGSAMSTLKETAEEIGALFAEHAKKVSNASLFVKLALVTIGAAVAAIAQSVELATANKEFSVWTIAGLAAIAIVAVGGVFVVMTETDVSKVLEAARRAVEDARLLERQHHDFEADRARLENEVGRGLELYNSMDVMRGAVEQSLGIAGITAAQIIQTGLDAAVNSLIVAFDFDIKDTWTICVFQATTPAESDKVTLQCVAHQRKIPCDIKLARKWGEGVGVTGVAYSMKHEIIIPDMMAPELGTVFTLNKDSRPHDANRYLSMAAIPITVGAETTPWGVAVVTSDQSHHFSPEAADGVPTVEPIRAIAAMAALAIKAVDGTVRAPSAPAPPQNRVNAEEKPIGGGENDTIRPESGQDSGT